MVRQSVRLRPKPPYSRVKSDAWDKLKLEHQATHAARRSAIGNNRNASSFNPSHLLDEASNSNDWPHFISELGGLVKPAASRWTITLRPSPKFVSPRSFHSLRARHWPIHVR